MVGVWLQDIEALEAISRDADARAVFLRIAHLSQNGRLHPFLRELADDEELDAETKGALAELAQDDGFLHAVEDYILRTSALN